MVPVVTRSAKPAGGSHIWPSAPAWPGEAATFSKRTVQFVVAKPQIAQLCVHVEVVACWLIEVRRSWFGSSHY